MSDNPYKTDQQIEIDYKANSKVSVNQVNKGSAIVGIAFVAIGVIALFGNGLFPLLGFATWGLASLWPLIVLGIGASFICAPFMVGKRGMAGMFIPGAPIMMTGIILLIASMFNYWSIWAWAWPLELVALSIGFIMAALGLQTRELFIPAIIIGANGLIFLACTVTGWWEAWSIIWTLEPLAVGIALLFTGSITENAGLRKAGWILCLIAGVAAVIMIAILSTIGISFIGSGILILLGVGLLLKGVLPNKSVEIDEIAELKKAQ